MFNPEKYLTIEALDDNVSISYYSELPVSLYVKIVDGIWFLLNKGSSVTINRGECVYLKSYITRDPIMNLSVVGRFKLKGNCMSLIYMDSADRFDEVNTSISGLFAYNEGLVEVSPTFLPATTLAFRCYSYMFGGCTNLAIAPELPATTLAAGCYSNMFYGCSKLNYIKMLATDISAEVCLSNWVYGVASSGTFVKNKNATWDVTGVNGVPSGWTIQKV